MPGTPIEPTSSPTPESPLAQIKSLRLSQNNLISLGIGGIVGLVLGLLIGWVWWPVEWQGAGLGELNSPARAAYLAAVADAFAQSDGGAARDTAQERLAALGAELPAQFDAAIRYYANAESPDRATITNLVTLALALQLQLESVTAQEAATGAAQQPAEPPPATVPATSTAETSAANGGSSTAAEGSRWNWLWVILLGALLVGGGVLVLRYVARRGPAQPQDTAGGAPEGSPKPTAAGAGATYSSQAGAARGNAQASGRTPPAAGQSATPNLQATIPPSAANTATASGGSVSYLNPVALNGQDSEHGFAAEDPEEEAGESPGTSGVSSTPTSAHAPGAGDSGPVSTATDLSRGSAPAPTPAWAVQPGRIDRYPVLHSHTATFQIGLENFDFAKNIPNPAGAGYLGEYGMVIPERLGTVGNNLEQVVAIEVNLFDKTDETEIKTVTRFLLSEYAMDHLYEQFARERRGVDPISAQPGTRFSLEGRQLLLDCVIREVAFTPERYFKKLTVEMNARRKTPG
jgi:hypothetical protein